jgi:23S rRNA pseudouridine1911/1915/1917 synthase
VKVNGETQASPKLEVEDTADIAISLPDKQDFSAKTLPIIYLDDNVIVVNKPVGVLTHSKGDLNDEFTVAEFFRRYSTYHTDTNRPGVVHRLDRDTSGVIIGARHAEAAEVLMKQFADRKAKKTYLAVLEGHPKVDKATIDLPIGRNPKTPSTFRVDAGGKAALTNYDVLDKTDDYSLVRLEPKTGRTHQLRVHMAYLGTPILGDRVYGAQAQRLLLHAYSLEITIPGSQRETFVAPVPENFTTLFPKLKDGLQHV